MAIIIDMTTQLLNTFGKRVRLLRDGLDWSQEDLIREMQRRTGVTVSQGHWSLIERSGKVPNGEIVAAAAKTLGVTADYLLLLTDEPYPPDVAEDDGAGISEEAEEAAILIDAMPPERRQDALAVVRALVQRQKADEDYTRDGDLRSFRHLKAMINNLPPNIAGPLIESLEKYLDDLRRGSGQTGTN